VAIDKTSYENQKYFLKLRSAGYIKTLFQKDAKLLIAIDIHEHASKLFSICDHDSSRLMLGNIAIGYNFQKYVF
jgi:hypothetical protein